jgi:hypothetical protein
MSDIRFITNVTKIIKQFNSSINLAEQKLISELNKQIKNSKMTVIVFDKLREKLKKVFRENACDLKLTPISNGLDNVKRYVSHYDVFNNEPYKSFTQSKKRRVPVGYTESDLLICANLRTTYNKFIYSRLLQLRNVVASFEDKHHKASAAAVDEIDSEEDSEEDGKEEVEEVDEDSEVEHENDMCTTGTPKITRSAAASAVDVNENDSEEVGEEDNEEDRTLKRKKIDRPNKKKKKKKKKVTNNIS